MLYFLGFTGWDDKYQMHTQYSLGVDLSREEHTAALGSLNELVEAGDLHSFTLEEPQGNFIIDRIHTLGSAIGFVQSHLPQKGDNNV